jgi:rare lipoprotein A
MSPVRTGCLLALVLLAGCAREPLRPPPPPTPAPGTPAPSTSPDAPAVPDGVSRDEPRAKHGNPPFYEVGGQRYVVLPSAVGYVEQGVASWYGPDFHGGRTATGETYDMDAMTGAHPTLPLPTWVRVTNLGNGKSVVVRLNDRGPFARGRIIDLSRAAAEALDMVRAGTARVEVQSLATGGTTPPAAPAAYYAQAGAFGRRENADALAGRLRAAGIEGVTVVESAASGSALFRVRAGPAASLPDFDRLVERMLAAGAEAVRLAL